MLFKRELSQSSISFRASIINITANITTQKKIHTVLPTKNYTIYRWIIMKTILISLYFINYFIIRIILISIIGIINYKVLLSLQKIFTAFLTIFGANKLKISFHFFFSSSNSLKCWYEIYIHRIVTKNFLMIFFNFVFLILTWFYFLRKVLLFI